ncbi:MAG: hypothetical protein HYY44_00910 [Deltaproteobacteria bacterium]|nr:hypothetical protein [Deltaproteobacteria bacterium]MBI4374751.1 hypothetical protein [Deltaproteobacteria bacterium]
MNRRRTGIGLFLFLFIGCAGEISKDPETLVWHLAAEPDTLNPITSTDAYASRVDGFLFDSLIERDNETFEWKPKMATRWEISPDQRQLTFTLREGIRWHDGHPFSIDDIVYSFERIIDPKVDAPHLRVYYQEMQKVEKLDERTVRFTFKRPYFMSLTFCGSIPVVPKHLYENGGDFNSHPLNRAPVGIGPYRFVTWDTGQKIVIERNGDYWGEKPDIKKIRFEMINDDSVALQVLKKGGLDFAGLRPIQWVRQTGSKSFSDRFQKYQFYTPAYSYIGWNMRRSFFSDARVRKAMTMMVNRQEILKKLNFGLGTEVTGPFYFLSKDYDPDLKPVPFDKEGAKALLKEAGWEDHDGDGVLDQKGVPFYFEFLLPSGARFSERLANILKEDLKGVGIGMTIRQLEWALFTKYLSERNFDAVVLGWSLSLEQDPYQLWHSSQMEKGSNIVGFSDPEADQIIEKGRGEFDRDRRALLYRRLHRIIYDAQPYTFLYTSPNLVALHRRFENVKVYPAGVDPLEWKISR